MERIRRAPRSLLIAATSTTLVICALFALGYMRANVASSSGTTLALQGYAWSSNIGWIWMNDTSPDGVVINDADNTSVVNKKLTGYAWSSSVGWIQFGNLACPAAYPGCNAYIDTSGSPYKVLGWARVINNTPTEGWDGWISLNCANTDVSTCSTYGVTVGTNGKFNNYAWGSDVVGWVDMSRVSFSPPNPDHIECVYPADRKPDRQRIDIWGNVVSNPNCPAGDFCYMSGGVGQCAVLLSGTLDVSPLLVKQGSQVSVSWSVPNNTTHQPCSVTDGQANVQTTGTSYGPQTWSNVIETKTVFTLTCQLEDGSYVDLASSTVNIIPSYTES